MTRNGLRFAHAIVIRQAWAARKEAINKWTESPGQGDRRRSERVSRRPPAMHHAVVGSDHPTPTCLSSFHVNIPHRDLDRPIERGGTGEIAGNNQHTEPCHPGCHPPAGGLEGPQTLTTSSARQGLVRLPTSFSEIGTGSSKVPNALIAKVLIRGGYLAHNLAGSPSKHNHTTH